MATPQKSGNDRLASIPLSDSTEDPPPYTYPDPAMDTTKHIDCIQSIIDGLFREPQDKVEDARLALALAFSSTFTGVSHEARLAEANQWIAEQNDWLNVLKDSFGCKFHELAIPALIDFKEPLDLTAIFEPYWQDTIESVKAKEAAAYAVSCEAESVEKAYETLEDKGLARPDTEKGWHEARILCRTANDITMLYNNSVRLMLIHQNTSLQIDRRRLACGITIFTSKAAAEAAMYTSIYHLYTAQNNNPSDANLAVQRAVRALAVCLTALSVFEASRDKLDYLGSQLESTRLNQPKTRRWITGTINRAIDWLERCYRSGRRSREPPAS